jgi:hypothetical protein
MVEPVFGASSQAFLVVEIPSFVVGLIAFLFIFLVIGIMFLVLRTERGKVMRPLNSLGPREVVRFDNPLSSSDAAYVAIITLVILELILDALVIAGAIQGIGSIAIGTMLALASFIAAAILAVYRSTYMSDAFMRKPRLELVASSLSGKASEGEGHE